jgi:hypothetical protein
MYGTSWRELQTTPRRKSWQLIRALRHSPPINAAGGFRREIFASSLEQAEQLFGAAANAGAETRPLLIFYGLSQAGRAIVSGASSVGNNDVRLSGHGLQVGHMPSILSRGLAALEVWSQKGAYETVAKVLGSTNLPRLPLGMLWELLPEADQFLLPNAQLSKPLGIRADITSDSSGFLVAVVGPIPANLRQPQSSEAELLERRWQQERENVHEYLRRYPSLADASFLNETGSVGLSLIGQDSAEVPLKWTITGCPGSALAELDRRTVVYRGDRIALAGLGDPPRPTHPLMIWWAILYVLSMLTRYEPEGWAKVVDVNTSPDAVPVEFLLEEALSVIPEEIHRAILQAGS